MIVQLFLPTDPAARSISGRCGNRPDAVRRENTWAVPTSSLKADRGFGKAFSMQLTDRSVRPARLTQAGLRLQNRDQRILDALSDIKSALRHADQSSISLLPMGNQVPDATTLTPSFVKLAQGDLARKILLCSRVKLAIRNTCCVRNRQTLPSPQTPFWFWTGWRGTSSAMSVCFPACSISCDSSKRAATAEKSKRAGYTGLKAPLPACWRARLT